MKITAKAKKLSALAAALAMVATLSGCEVGSDGQTDSTAADYPTKSIHILAPGSTGGGWDTRARSIQSGLADCDITDVSVDVTNNPGAGGTIGLADFVTKEGDPYQLMVMDTITMLGGIIRNDSPYDLSELTPIAGLTGARDAVVVPKDSPFKSMDDVRKALKEDPKSVAWAGGSLGGPDHITAALLAKKDGVDISDVNYVATGGGSEVLSLLLSGSASLATSTLTELQAQIDAGELRVLAVSGEERVDGLDAPTLKEEGLEDIDFSSTGGLMAPPGVSDEDAQAIIDMVTKLHDTKCWDEALEKNAWEDSFTTGEEFGDLIERDNEAVAEVLDELDLTDE